MIYKNIVMMIIVIVESVYLLVQSFKYKNRYASLGIIMIIIGLVGIELLSDFKEIIRFSIFAEIYTLLVFIILLLSGIILVSMNIKDNRWWK